MGQRKRTHTLSFPLRCQGGFIPPPQWGCEGRGDVEKALAMGVSPLTPTGKALALVLVLGPRSHPCGDSPCPLTAWSSVGLQSCFLPWCIRAVGSDPRWESRDGTRLRGASNWSQSHSFSFLQRSQQLKRSAWLAPAPCRLNSGLPMNIGVLFVPQQEAWVVERMGKFHRILEPVRSCFSPLLDSAGS